MDHNTFEQAMLAAERQFLVLESNRVWVIENYGSYIPKTRRSR